MVALYRVVATMMIIGKYGCGENHQQQNGG